MQTDGRFAPPLIAKTLDLQHDDEQGRPAMSMNAVPPRWYDRKSLVIILLLALWPVGVVGLWRSGQFGRATKVLVTVMIVLLMLMILITPDNTGETHGGSVADAGEASAELDVASNGTSVPSLAALQNLDRSTPEWSAMHDALTDMARDPHRKGTPYDPQSGGWDWAHEQALTFKSWLAWQPLGDVALSVLLEKNSVCGDWQAVVTCRQRADISSLEKTGLLMRLNHEDGSGFRPSIAIAFAMEDTVYDRWTGAEVNAFMEAEVGPRPEMPKTRIEDNTLTLAERRKPVEACVRNLEAWSKRFEAFWDRVEREAGIPSSDD